MGRRAECNSADDALSIDTKWLKDHGYFCGLKYGAITWTWNWSGKKSTVGFTVHVHDIDVFRPFIRFQYTTKSWYEEEEKEMDYMFDLVKVPCNLGGFRWAFKCGLSKNNNYCGRIVYTLFKAGSDYFGCRKCMNIVYESQRQSGSRFEHFGKMLKNEKKYYKLADTIKKRHYRGIPTKKMQKLMRLEAQLPSIEQIAFMELSLLSNKNKK